jgi:hypothetical protein
MGKNQGIEKPEGTGTWILIPTMLLMLYFLIPALYNGKSTAQKSPAYSSNSINTTSFLIN